MRKTITIKVQLEEWEFNILQNYGYQIAKKVEEHLKEIAYYLAAEASNDSEDIGTATINEMRKQNGEF